MKRLTWVLLGFVAVTFIFFAIIKPTAERTEARERARLYLLDAIKTSVSLSLEYGGQLPTNWITISNSTNWNLVVEIYKYNNLPPPMESYTVLAKPVTNPVIGGRYFLLASEASKRPAGGMGRWALTVEPNPQYFGSSPLTAPKVIRTWINEEDVSLEILRQIGTNRSDR